MPRDPQGAETRTECGGECILRGRRFCEACAKAVKAERDYAIAEWRRQRLSKTIPPHAGEETKG